MERRILFVSGLFITTLIWLTVSLIINAALTGHKTKDPIFTVDSSTVKAYNLTGDLLFCIINLGVRVRVANPAHDYFSFNSIRTEVRKGIHHALANDVNALFKLDLVPEGNHAAVVQLEAVGLHVGLERKIAAEVRADAEAGEGRVNVFMDTFVDEGSKSLGVECVG